MPNSAVYFVLCLMSTTWLIYALLLSWFVAAYEAENHLPRGTIRQAVIGQANNAWELLERGEISVDEFNRKFSDDCSEIVSLNLL